MNVFFKNIFIRFLSNDSIEIRWEVEQSIFDPQKIAYVVYKAEQQGGDFKQISPELIDLYTYRDFYEGNTVSKFRTLFYKVRAIDLDNKNNFVESPIEYIHENPFDDSTTPFQDPVIDIVRRENFILKHDRYRVGKPCIIYQKRISGQQCSCFDPITRRVTKSNCQLCLGTGKIEGYHSGIEDIYVSFISLPKQKAIQLWGDLEPGETQAWMSNYPLVKPEDIIVNKLSNEHWLVKRVRTSVHLIVSRQTLLVRKLNFDDIKTRLRFEMKKYRI